MRAQAGRALDRLGMVALVVGVSTMIRPMIHEAIAAAEIRPALPEAEDGASGNGGPGDEAPALEAISPEELERLLAGTEEARE